MRTQSMKSKNAATLVSAMLVLTACVEEPRSSAEVVLGQAQSASQAQGASLVERLEQDRGSIAAAQAQPRSVVTPESKSVTQTPRADASVASAEQTGSERPTADSLPGTPSLAPAPQQPPVEIAQADPKPMTESDQPRIPVQDTVQETTQETRSTRIVVPPTAEQPTAATPSVSKPVPTSAVSFSVPHFSRPNGSSTRWAGSVNQRAPVCVMTMWSSRRTPNSP